MPHSTKPAENVLSADTVDDLIYSSRIGDLPSLQESIDTLSATHACHPLTILQSAIDVDEDGLGSGSCLLHYPAANGNIAVVSYLLTLIGSPPTTNVINTDDSSTANDNVVMDAPSQSSTQPSASVAFVNHQNVSGNTALHWAGMNGHLAIVQALVNAGASPEIVNTAGRDAVVESEWSSQPGAAECAVWMLKECGGLERGIGEGVGDAAEQEVDDIEEEETVSGGPSRVAE